MESLTTFSPLIDSLEVSKKDYLYIFYQFDPSVEVDGSPLPLLRPMVDLEAFCNTAADVATRKLTECKGLATPGFLEGTRQQPTPGL